MICKLGEQPCCERQVWVARVLFSGSCFSSALALVCLFVGILNSSRVHPLDLTVEVKNSSFGEFWFVLLSFRKELKSRLFLMLLVGLLSIDHIYFPLKDMLYILYASLWTVLEAQLPQCSWTDNFRTAFESSYMILHWHKNCASLPLPLSKHRFCFGKGKGSSCSLT